MRVAILLILGRHLLSHLAQVSLLLLILGALLGLLVVMMVQPCAELLLLAHLELLLGERVPGVLHLLKLLQGLLKLVGLLLWVEPRSVHLVAVVRLIRGLHERLALALQLKQTLLVHLVVLLALPLRDERLLRILLLICVHRSHYTVILPLNG
mgnify:CR=1 FL=1